VHAVLARAMDEDPARRYSTALAFAAALETAAREGVADRTATAAPLPRVEAPPPPVTPPPAAAAPAVEPKAAPPLTSPVQAPEAVEVAPEAVEQEEEEPVVAASVAPIDLARLHDHAEPASSLQTTPVRHGTLLNVDAPEIERPRSPMLPIALTAIVCLLIGFAAGYALGGRDHAASQGTTVASNPPAASTSAQPVTQQPQRSGQAWSEQAVRQPSAAPSRGGSAGSAATAPPPAPTRASLTVESTPKNAPVTVNGKWRGRTPLTIDDLPFGTYALRIVQPGYTVARQVVTLTKAQPSRTVNFHLQRPEVAAPAPAPAASQAARGAAPARDRFSGSLFVASNPPGARVFVDGRPFGTAPARIPEVPIGSHVVRLELPSHRAWTTSIRVAAGQETRVAGSLEPIQ
jgi:hypothetical protein